MKKELEAITMLFTVLLHLFPRVSCAAGTAAA